MYILAVVSLIWIAWKLGKEDGKWGLFIVLVIVFLITAIATAFK